MPSKYAQVVTKLLANLDEENNQQLDEEEPEVSYHVHHFPDALVIIKEPRGAADEQVIDSTTAPRTQSPQEGAPIQPLRRDKTSERIAYAILSVCLLMVCSIIMLQIYSLMNTPSATITIIPKSHQITLTGTLQLGRVIAPITVSQSTTAPTTGKGHQDAEQATGFITFYDGQATQVFIPAGTTLTGSSGEQIITDQDATIPPESQTIPPTLGQATVSAHAVSAGSAGNIPVGDINQSCCQVAIKAINTSVFKGGQDERNFQTVTTKDIQGVAQILKTDLLQSMTGALQAQLKQGEQLQTQPCSPTVTPDHRAGEEATQVKVTVSETCSAVAYNQDTLQAKVTQLLTTQAIKKLGTGYSELGNTQVNVTQAGAQHTKAVLSFSSSGTWVYALSTQEQEHIKHLIQGKTKQEALRILALQPGIKRTSIQWDKNTKLPKDTRYIHLVIFAGIYQVS